MSLTEHRLLHSASDVVGTERCLLSPPPGTAECILIIRLPPLCCVCAIAVFPSRSLSARFRPAWLIVADFATSVLSELCCFPLLNYSVFVAVADRLRVLFS